MGVVDVCLIFLPGLISLQAFGNITMNRQGNDFGTQHRSAVFYHNDEQKKIAEEYKKKLNAEKVYPNPIITEITPILNYYPAENYHQNY
jgi:peptide-methionine (S)-S-oxide reductase